MCHLSWKLWGEETPGWMGWIVLISSFLTSLQLPVWIRCNWANIGGGKVGRCQCLFYVHFYIGSDGLFGLWLTISTELDDPRKSHPKPLHKHPKLLSAARADTSQCGSIWDHTSESGTNWTRKFGTIWFSRKEDQNFDFWFLGTLVPP